METNHNGTESKILYPLATELKGLSGTFHLFDNEQFSQLHVQQLPGDRICVVTHKGTVTLNNDDVLRIDRYNGDVSHIAGPNGHSDPFRKIVAGTSIGQKGLSLGFDETVYINRYEMADGFESGDNFHKQHQSWIGSYHDDQVISGMKVIVVINMADHRLLRIIVRKNAGEKEVQWLQNYIRFKMHFRKPSGAFDSIRARIQDEYDETYRIWMEDVLNEVNDQRERKFHAALELIKLAGTATVKVDGDEFITNNGSVYRRTISQKTQVREHKLKQNGLYLKIAEAALKQQPQPDA